jgi:hypothetical protein
MSQWSMAQQDCISESHFQNIDTHQHTLEKKLMTKVSLLSISLYEVNENISTFTLIKELKKKP